VRTNIEIDDDLLAAAMEAAGTTTKRATVEAGLATLVRLRRMRDVRLLRGTVDWHGDLDESRSGRDVAS
jgi:Arc/MetJ family transcription regulator